MKIAILLLTLALSSASLYAEVPIEATVRLFTDGNPDEGGLQLLLKQRDYPGVKTDKITFEVQIINWMLEEVFVEVTDLADAPFSLFGDPIGWSAIFFPDNASLLKRLHAATVTADGKRSTCACGMAVVKQTSELGREVDLSEFIGRTGTLIFRVSGFYRSNGKKFAQEIKLHFNIVAPGKSEQGGAGQPATSPESKTERGENLKPDSVPAPR